jgi:hypothetical protein
LETWNDQETSEEGFYPSGQDDEYSSDSDLQIQDASSDAELGEEEEESE